jgi:hypothetical protein
MLHHVAVVRTDVSEGCMEAIRPSETLIRTRAMRFNIQEDGILLRGITYLLRIQSESFIRSDNVTVLVSCWLRGAVPTGEGNSRLPTQQSPLPFMNIEGSLPCS